MTLIQTPIIIPFANQKGGVGKTTLCACFANYLSELGYRIKVIDCDRQQSISKCRQRDLANQSSTDSAYEVVSQRMITKEAMVDLLKRLYATQTEDIVLFDCPGSMHEPWLIPLMANADAVVIPIHFDNITIASTSEFILYVEKIGNSTQRQHPVKLFFIPNLTDKRVGTREELQRWDKIRQTYSAHGTITPYITQKAEMTRFDTTGKIGSQSSIVADAFHLIHTSLFGKSN